LTGSQVLSIAGIVLTLAGGGVLLYRDLHPRVRTYAEVLYGSPRREAWIGYPLIAAGAALEILGIASS
jgi:hypothetical protein